MKRFIIPTVIILLFTISACSTSNTITTTEAFVDTNEDGVQDIQLSYGKVGYSFNYILSPNTVEVDVPVRVTTKTETLYGCYKYIRVPAYGISKYITSSANTFEFTPSETGQILFTCSMGMGTVELTVE